MVVLSKTVKSWRKKKAIHKITLDQIVKATGFGRTRISQALNGLYTQQTEDGLNAFFDQYKT